MESIIVGDLMRNDRVVRNDYELPYLVEEATEMDNGNVQVTYSSGDVVEYERDEEVLIK